MVFTLIFIGYLVIILIFIWVVIFLTKGRTTANTNIINILNGYRLLPSMIVKRVIKQWKK